MAEEFNATNRLPTRELFEARNLYKQYAYAAPKDVYVRPIFFPMNVMDFSWAEHAFYGKVSDGRFFNALQPMKDALRPLKTAGTPIRVLGPVALAFKRFKQDFLVNVQQGNLSKNDPMLSEINPVKGYTGVDEQYRDFRKDFYNSFNRYLKNKHLKNKINDLDDFIKELINFVQSYNAVFTKTAFIMSRFCDPLMSGLSIDLLDLPYSEDAAKKEFIDSPNFASYVTIARNHGFLVDKNIPWRLVANLYNSRMHEYANEFMVSVFPDTTPKYETPDSMLKAFFIPVVFADLNVFQTNILKFYNQFVIDNPVNIVASHSQGVTAKTRLTRSKKTWEEYMTMYDAHFWLNHFVRIRNQETGLNYSESALKSIVNVAVDRNLLDRPDIMGYIERKFAGITFYEGSKGHSQERILRQSTGRQDTTVEEACQFTGRLLNKTFF